MSWRKHAGQRRFMHLGAEGDTNVVVALDVVQKMYDEVKFGDWRLMHA